MRSGIALRKSSELIPQLTEALVFARPKAGLAGEVGVLMRVNLWIPWRGKGSAKGEGKEAADLGTRAEGMERAGDLSARAEGMARAVELGTRAEGMAWLASARPDGMLR